MENSGVPSSSATPEPHARDGDGPAVGQHRFESSLIVPVPASWSALEPYRHLNPAMTAGLPPHVTALYPFVATPLSDEMADRIRLICRQIPIFEFSLTAVEWFDERVAYLTVEPNSRFKNLTECLAASFPEFPPYEGAFDNVIPHVTLAEDAKPGAMRRASRKVRKQLPIRAQASELSLWLSESAGTWRQAAVFPLGEDAKHRKGGIR